MKQSKNLKPKCSKCQDHGVERVARYKNGRKKMEKRPCGCKGDK
jgi:hypothetical protein